MNPNHLHTLEHFLTRTPMWIHPIDETTIVSFLHGFEAGIGEQAFTTEIKTYLASEYDVFGSSQGWPRQILLYAEQRKVTWSEAFVEIGMRVLERLQTAARP